MKQTLRGTAFVLGDNIDTDQIIPAEYLSYNPAEPADRKYFGKYALSGVPQEQSGLPNGSVPFVEEGQFRSRFNMIIAGRNFGFGSSREHAPLAISQAGVRVIVAESYARIFYRNSVNGGYLLPLETSQRLIDQVSTGNELEISTATGRLTDLRSGKSYPLKPLGDVAEIVEAGGIFPYAKRAGLLKPSVEPESR